MSRILCPECGTKISNKATKCPHCGFQSADPKRPISEQDKYEMVPIFEYDIEEWQPNRGELSIISYEDNRSLIQYFGKWENIKVKLPAIAEVIGAMAGKEHIMVAKMDSYVKDLIGKGIYRFTIDKQGEILPTIRDADGFVKQVRLENMALTPNLTQSLNNLSTHAVMAQILDEIEYEYDAEMRIVKVLESNTETASYTYDANGNKTSETQANGVVSTYTYNSANKITNLITKSSNSTISEYEYSYYLDGSDAYKVRKESGIIETRSYEYDGLKRLTEEAVTTGSSTDTYAYEYDDYGNRSKMTATGSETYETVYDYTTNGKYTALLQKETKTVDGTSEEIVANGLATSPADLLTTDNSDVEEIVYTYDANGNQITKTADGKTETNTYDGLNQLIGFTDGETTASYTYDVDGLRLSKTVDGKTTKHVWDGNQQLVADVLDSELYSANCYLRGTNLVATYSYQNGEKSGYTYYTQNAHGDVVNLTDSTGEITKSYTYDAFGVEKNIDDADTNAFRYCGEYYDSESGTIYLRARYYDPSTGRFISRDSYAGKNSDPLSLNRYTYCHNNPIFYADPKGHSAWTKFQEAAFAVEHPFIASKIGTAKPDDANSNTISSRAARFAINSKVSYNYKKGQENEGGQRNALRHAIWSTTITRYYGKEIMKQVGYSHENLSEMLKITSDPTKWYFSDMHTADTLCDIMNNETGMKIAASGDATNMRSITLEVLEYYHTNGLYVAVEYADNLYIVQNQKLSDQEYASATYNVFFLDQNGLRGNINTVADIVRQRKKEANSP